MPFLAIRIAAWQPSARGWTKEAACCLRFGGLLVSASAPFPATAMPIVSVYGKSDESKCVTEDSGGERLAYESRSSSGV